MAASGIGASEIIEILALAFLIREDCLLLGFQLIDLIDSAGNQIFQPCTAAF